MKEHPLPGNATAGVVRVGNTVRRPAGPWTDAVEQLLLHLERVGFDGAPRALGRDDQGRQVLEFVEGEPGADSPDHSTRELAAIARLMREFHEAASTFVAPHDAQWNQVLRGTGTELICHGDAVPWNIVDTGSRLVLIDWDAAGPGTRLWELAYTFQTVGVPTPRTDPDVAARRLRTLADSYGLDGPERVELVRLLPLRTQAMVDLLHRGYEHHEQPWARIWHEDGAHWTELTRMLGRHEQRWLAALT